MVRAKGDEGDYDRFISEKDEIDNFYGGGQRRQRRWWKREGARQRSEEDYDLNLGIIEVDEEGWEEDDWNEEKLGGKQQQKKIEM